ncbi:MAG: hypothetical protein DI539_10010 [Flavobacterium psychrophilum]|nr:MAG: hypothetical protein DI539_10010 [Flavobacterium psychrophilum]
MNIPTIHGFIDRRILVNFTIDPDIAAKIIPAPFRPKLYGNKAIGGICLIRLKYIKPKILKGNFGISSENAAHRFAVEWDEDGIIKEGVYIPRRNTSSIINSFAGGRLFPGKHYHSKFKVDETHNQYNVSFTHDDGTGIDLRSKATSKFDNNSIFKNIQNASQFFENGALGYSPGKGHLDGILLNTYRWEVSPLDITEVKSNYFENTSIFPEGSVNFDHALLMRNIEHEWISSGIK